MRLSIRIEWYALITDHSDKTQWPHHGAHNGVVKRRFTFKCSTKMRKRKLIDSNISPLSSWTIEFARCSKKKYHDKKVHLATSFCEYFEVNSHVTKSRVMLFADRVFALRAVESAFCLLTCVTSNLHVKVNRYAIIAHQLQSFYSWMGKCSRDSIITVIKQNCTEYVSFAATAASMTMENSDQEKKSPALFRRRT